MAPGALMVSVPSLRYWRGRRLLDQAELAKQAGVAVRSINRGEHGSPLRVDVARRLAEALRITPEQLQAPPPSD